MGEPCSKSWKKGVLIEKVRAAREKANNTTCTAPVRNTVTTGHERSTGHSSDSDSADSFTAKARANSTSTSSSFRRFVVSSFRRFVVSSFRRVQRVVRPTQILYYFDEKKERWIHLLLLVLFLIGKRPLRLCYLCTDFNSGNSGFRKNNLSVFLVSCVIDDAVDLFNVCASKCTFFLW